MPIVIMPRIRQSVVQAPTDVYDSFEGSGALNSSLWDTYDPDSETALTVTQSGGKYNGSVSGAGELDTTWLGVDEGVMHSVQLTGNIDFIGRNAGLDSGSDPGFEYQFCGLIIWLSAGNYEFIVPGNRGTIATNTIEYKSTLASSSTQNDIGTDAIWNDKADLRIRRIGSTVTFWYQQPGTSPDNWIEIPMSSLSHRVDFGTGTVRCGMITYGFSFPTNFTGTIDQIEIPTGTFV